jgi:hypothetical protein
LQNESLREKKYLKLPLNEFSILPDMVISMNKPSLIKISYSLVLLTIETISEEDNLAHQVSDLFEKLFNKILKISKADLYDVERYINLNATVAKRSVETLRGNIFYFSKNLQVIRKNWPW